MSELPIRSQNTLEYYKQAYEQSVLQNMQLKKNLLIHKEIISTMVENQAGDNNETVNQFQSLVRELESQIKQLRNENDLINTKLLIQSQVSLDTGEEYESKIKELNERIAYLQQKYEEKESLLQFKEKKWSDFEEVVIKFVRKDPTLLDDFCSINYLCDDLSSVRKVNTVYKENDWLKKKLAELEKENKSLSEKMIKVYNSEKINLCKNDAIFNEHNSQEDNKYIEPKEFVSMKHIPTRKESKDIRLEDDNDDKPQKKEISHRLSKSNKESKNCVSTNDSISDKTKDLKNTAKNEEAAQSKIESLHQRLKSINENGYCLSDDDSVSFSDVENDFALRSSIRCKSGEKIEDFKIDQAFKAFMPMREISKIPEQKSPLIRLDSSINYDEIFENKP